MEIMEFLKKYWVFILVSIIILTLFIPTGMVDTNNYTYFLAPFYSIEISKATGAVDVSSALTSTTSWVPPQVYYTIFMTIIAAAVLGVSGVMNITGSKPKLTKILAISGLILACFVFWLQTRNATLTNDIYYLFYISDSILTIPFLGFFLGTAALVIQGICIKTTDWEDA